MLIPLRIDHEQRFTCASCSRCCRRWEILVSEAEAELLRRRDAGRWFRERADAFEGAARDPCEPVPGWQGFHRIRKRDDGACGFLSPGNRCRLHEELGGRHKPLTCRMFPYRLLAAPDAVVVTTSFGCPTVVANQGEPIASSATMETIRSLRAEWFSGHRQKATARLFVAGRAIESATVQVLRNSFLQMLNRSDEGGRDLRSNVRRMAAAIEDLTRSQVVRLADADFAEYVALTAPFAASTDTPVPPRAPAWVGRLLQRGFLFVVAATRMRLEDPAASRFWLRLRMLRLLAHFHGLAPAVGRINVRGLRRSRVDVNAPEIQPIAHHYLRASIESLGASERPVLDDFAIAVSCLNAACALAVMNANAAGQPVDRALFSEALMEAVDLTHLGDRGLIGRILERFAGGVEAFHAFARTDDGPEARA